MTVAYTEEGISHFRFSSDLGLMNMLGFDEETKLSFFNSLDKLYGNREN